MKQQNNCANIEHNQPRKGSQGMHYSVPLFYYKNKNINSLIKDYLEDGYCSYSSLDQLDKERLAIECIKELGSDAYHCIIDCEGYDKLLKYFMNFLKTSDMNEGYELLETMRKNATEYFTFYLDVVFSDMYEERQQEIYNERKWG